MYKARRSLRCSGSFHYYNTCSYLKHDYIVFFDCHVNHLFITNPECVKSQNNISIRYSVKPRPP